MQAPPPIANNGRTAQPERQQGDRMDWSDLLGDLETQMLAEERLELAAEVADRAVREAATLGLADRLRAAVGTTVRLEVCGAGVVRGRLAAVGPDWLTVREVSAGDASFVPTAAISAVRELPPGAAPLEGVVATRYTAQMVLRRISSAGLPVVVTLRDGAARRGLLAVVGKDYVELVEDGCRTLLAASALSVVRPA
jgi:predicted metalloprotease